MTQVKRSGPPIIPGLLEDDSIGLCPTCKRCSGWLAYDGNHYGVCTDHQLAWIWGTYDEDPDFDCHPDCESNAAILEGCKMVEQYMHGSDGASVTLPVYEPEPGGHLL